MAQLDVERGAATGTRIPARHHAHRLAGTQILASLHVQALEAGQHRVVAAAAIDDQQQAIAAE